MKDCGCKKYGKTEMKKDMVKSCHSCKKYSCCDSKKYSCCDSKKYSCCDKVKNVCGCECSMKCESHYTNLCCHKGYNSHRHYIQNKHYIKSYVKDHGCGCGCH